mgnify:CR=1 FL=1
MSDSWWGSTRSTLRKCLSVSLLKHWTVWKNVAYLRVSMSVSHIMQIKQGLVHMFLQIQSCLAGLQCRFPLIFLWLLFSQKDTKIKKLFLRITNQKETDKDQLQNPTKHIPKFTCRFMKYTYFRSNAMLKHHGLKKTTTKLPQIKWIFAEPEATDERRFIISTTKCQSITNSSCENKIAVCRILSTTMLYYNDLNLIKIVFISVVELKENASKLTFVIG